jgi:UDP:flavonoid glycosyltransferase YjiC (YdhE family)
MSAPRRFILAPTGSTGDILPFVWLGKLLAAAGHDVLAVVHEPFGTSFATAGIRAAVYGTGEEYDALLRHPDLWHPKRGFALVARMQERWYRHAVPRLQAEIAPGRTTLVAPGISLGGRIASEAYQLPLVTVQLQPMGFMSLARPPVLRAGWEWFPESPLWLRRLAFRLLWWKTDWLLADNLNAFRYELGLTGQVRQVLRHYWCSPQRVLALFPEWYGPRAPDWPSQAVTTRFPESEPAQAAPLPLEIEEFLAEGAPPLLFTPGTANSQAARFLDTAVRTCVQLGARGLLLTPYRDHIPADLPRSVRWFREAPFAKLFPRCRTIVHHGGVGTVSQALAAGTPQFVMPMSHDQPDNAARVRRLGVGDYLYPKQSNTPLLVDRLRAVMSSKEIARACHQARDRMRGQMHPAHVAELIAEIA